MTKLFKSARDAVVVAMHAIIGEISEQNYAADWMEGIEFEVWRDAQARETGAFDRGYLTQLAALRELSALIDGWVDYDGYVPMADWQKRLAARSERTAAVEVADASR
jgi:hypothetical protein